MNAANDLFVKLVSFKTNNKSDRNPGEALLQFISNVVGAIERVHIDFKEKADPRNPTLSDPDKKNLAKAISGFANSGGGVLLWGLEDQTLEPKPIDSVDLFVSNLLELSPHLTDPPAMTIDGDFIPIDTNGSMHGFGIILVPESILPPHRVILNQKTVRNRYFIRSGGSFIEASHTQLEDMFGRRPRPNLSISTRIVQDGSVGREARLRVLIGVQNDGRGPARSPYLAIHVRYPYQIGKYGIDGNGNFGLDETLKPIGTTWQGYGSSSLYVIHSGVTLDVSSVEMKIDPDQPYGDIQDLIVDYRIAAEGVGLIEGTVTIDGKTLRTHAEK